MASELEYKTNILVDLITAILSLVGSIFLLSIFFQNTGNIGGWKFEQALIIQGIYTVLNGITNTWFNPNLREIVRHVREGTLDFVLLKPIDSQFFISLKKISLSFKKNHLILDNISLDISKGQVIGLLGPNGAGKSSLMNLITGAIKPNFGNKKSK